ncbi:hypothetical protein [Lentisphaera araneosa]|nr:hypothetical protein [Lentisphaera araneosa]
MNKLKRFFLLSTVLSSFSLQVSAKELSPEQLEEEKRSYTFLNDAGDSLWNTPGNWRTGKFKSTKSTLVPGKAEDLLIISASAELIKLDIQCEKLTTGFHRDSSVHVDGYSSLKSERMLIGFVPNKTHSFTNAGKITTDHLGLKNGSFSNTGSVATSSLSIGRKDSKSIDFTNSGKIEIEKDLMIHSKSDQKINMTSGIITAATLRATGDGQLNLHGGKISFDSLKISDDFKIDIQGKAKLIISGDVKAKLTKRINNGTLTGKGLVIFVNKKQQTIVTLHEATAI